MRIDQRIDQHLKESKMGELDAAVKRIEKMTSKNDHDGARIAAAELVNKFSSFKSKVFLAAYTGVRDIHVAEGNLPASLLKYRDELDKRFYGFVKTTFEEDTSISDRIIGAL